jgi:hypothetical protein
MEMLMGYGVPEAEAISAGWHLIYDMVNLTATDENPFENVIDARRVLQKAVGQLRGTNGLHTL